MPRRQPPTLGEIIRQERELLDVSMRQFADRVGISNPYLSQIERGLRAPSEQVLNAIARALRMSADALYERAGIKPPRDAGAGNEVLDAISADKRLSARQRTALKEVYRAFVAAPQPPASRTRAR